MQAIDTARQILISQLEPLDAKATELKDQLAALEADRWRLEAALKALDATKKPKARPIGKAAKPSPKQKDVRDVAIALATANPGLLKSALEDLTKDKLTSELGFDLKGFEMRWNEVMGSDTFTIFMVGEDECVRLASTNSDAELGDRKNKNTL